MRHFDAFVLSTHPQTVRAAIDRHRRGLRREHRIAASVTPYATEHVRLGTGLWVDEADVDAAIGAIRRL